MRALRARSLYRRLRRLTGFTYLGCWWREPVPPHPLLTHNHELKFVWVALTNELNVLNLEIDHIWGCPAYLLADPGAGANHGVNT